MATSFTTTKIHVLGNIEYYVILTQILLHGMENSKKMKMNSWTYFGEQRGPGGLTGTITLI